jgi:hypothetical protein
MKSLLAWNALLLFAKEGSSQNLAYDGGNVKLLRMFGIGLSIVLAGGCFAGAQQEATPRQTATTTSKPPATSSPSAKIAVKNIGGHHSGEVHRIFCAAELTRIAELGFLKVVNGCAHLDRHRKCTDPLIHCWTILAQGLRPSTRPFDLRIDHF